jgi:hypothetical protein
MILPYYYDFANKEFAAGNNSITQVYRSLFTNKSFFSAEKIDYLNKQEEHNAINPS